MNPEQRDAYEYDGHCVVLAGPGSGKTRVLVAKAARLVARRVRGPRGVACITYNNECAREIRRRFQALGIPTGRNLFVGTLHSFCLSSIIRPFGHLFVAGLGQQPRVAGNRMREVLLQQAMETSRIEGRADAWAPEVNIYRRTRVLTEERQSPVVSALARVAENYEAALHSAGVLDFDDLVLTTLRLLREEPLVRAAVSARFPFLVVDEYQDLGYPLHLIVQTLKELTEMEIFAVGDDNQSIYGFAGADPRYLRELAHDPNVHVVELDRNYRCADRIIKGSEIVLGPTSRQHYSAARSSPAGEIRIVECSEGLSQQATTIVEDIIPECLATGVAPNRIAILYIDRFDAEVLRPVLDDAGIKYAGERDQRYPRTPVTRWLEDVAKWVLCNYVENPESGPPLAQLYQTWLELQSGDTGVAQWTLKGLSHFFEGLRQSCGQPDDSLADFLARLDDTLGIEEILKAVSAHPDHWESWQLLRQRCGPGGSIEDFTIETFAMGGGHPDAITLTTLHSSKGLEYDVVIIPGLEQGRLPGYRAGTDEALAEARRVFYVGLTRARDVAFLMYSGWYSIWDRAIESGPSVFVRELMDDVGEREMPAPAPERR